MKKSTNANAAQLILNVGLGTDAAAPESISVFCPGDRIIQVNIDVATTANYLHYRLTQRGRVIYPLASANEVDPEFNGWLVAKSLTQTFVDIPVMPDQPITLEAFNTSAANVFMAVTIVTAGESAESLLSKILEQIEELTNAAKLPPP